MVDKFIPLIMAGFGFFGLALGAGATKPDDGYHTGHVVMEEVLNTKLATMQGQINRGFEQQAYVINQIGSYLEALQKDGKLPKTSEILKDETH